jgi:signal transduction histidine kinase
VRQIAARHGGTVACDADPAGGSRFVVCLPLGRGPD